uniref:Putative secreted protein n=1 Tax=Anopheles triannulatus TaxID=58253 RepID=A0A2M4B456_9DIPT
MLLLLLLWHSACWPPCAASAWKADVSVASVEGISLEATPWTVTIDSTDSDNVPTGGCVLSSSLISGVSVCMFASCTSGGSCCTNSPSSPSGVTIGSSGRSAT